MSNKGKTGFLYLTVFITGASVLMIEILGIRVIGPFFGTTVFVWSALITVTLGALALGYWVGGVTADKHPSEKLLFWAILLAGITTSLIMLFDRPVLMLTDRFGLRFGPLVAAALLFCPCLFLLGMVSPLAIKMRTRIIEEVGVSSGSIFAFSTVGSLFGGVLAGFVLLPRLSMTTLFLALGICLILLSLCINLIFCGAKKLTGKQVGLIFLAVVTLSLFLNWLGDFKRGRGLARAAMVIHSQSFYTDLKVLSFNNNKTRCLLANGYLQSCISRKTGKSDFYNIKGISQLVRQRYSDWQSGAAEGDKFRILMLGLGGGSLPRWLPRQAAVDLVEIDPQVVELAARYFQLNLHGGQRIIIDDARRFLRRTDTKYNVIICTVFSGGSLPFHLFTVEFFELLKERLTSSGMGLALLVSQPSSANIFTASMMRTVSQVFEHAYLTSPFGAAETDKSDDLLVHMYMQPESTPKRGLPGSYSVVPLEWEHGQILTDERTSISLLEFENLQRARQEILNSYGGYGSFFAY